MADHGHAHACGCNQLPVEPIRSEADEAIDEVRQGLNFSRRSILAGLGAAGITTALAPTASAVPTTAGDPPAALDKGLRLVTLGTRSGPPIDPTQVGIASALVIDGQVYLVDAGRAAATQYVVAGLKLANLKAIFITHLHADHISDYYNLFLHGAHIRNRLGDHITQTVEIHGPGSAGGLPAALPTSAPLYGPDDPWPGIKEMTDGLHKAYAYSNNIFQRDMVVPDLRTVMDVHEIALPLDCSATYQDTAPRMRPFEVYRDDKIEVTATLVPHGSVFPAFAFRFETEYGVVTFSGDTRVSDNLIELAHRSDILVHEAGQYDKTKYTPQDYDHMLQSHTTIEQVGGVAMQAHARHLVLSHTSSSFGIVYQQNWEDIVRQTYRGRISVAHDLDQYSLQTTRGRS